MAAILAATLAFIALVVGSIVVAIGVQIGDGDINIDPGVLVYLAALVFVYAFGFAFLGGLLGASIRNRQSVSRPDGGASRT